MADKLMTVESTDCVLGADTNGDGHICEDEMAMMLEGKRKKLEDEDAMRDAQRKMAWFALFGMLLYPFAVVISVWIVSVAAIVAAFFAKEVLANNKSK
jgi:hypothetical protein